MLQQKNTAKIVAALSATTALLIVSCCLGPTQARYENYSQWRATYQPQQQLLHSDRLTSEGQTVLLQDWILDSAAARMEAITITGSVGTMQGVLHCESDHPEYVTASLDRSEITVSTVGAQVQLTMAPTQAALELTEQITATVRVELLPEGAEKPALWADYQVVLLGAEPEETEPEETQAEETEPEETQPKETEPEQTQAEETEPGETQPEETEPVVMQVEQTQPEETGSEETQTEETEPEQIQPAPVALSIDSTDVFAWEEQLAIKVTAPAGADTLILTMNDANFLAGTRYTYNQKAFLLGADMPIEIAIQDEQTPMLLLDFSLLSAPQSGEISLQAQTLHQQRVTGTGEITVGTTREALRTDPEAFSPVLTGKNVLRIPLYADTDGLTWQLEMLTETEEGIAYTQSAEQYYLVITISEETGESGSQKFITISNVGGKAPAGTYRLTLERLQNEQVISSLEIPFFVCY